MNDILIGFDDNRTRSCLEMLGEMAAGTQVLLFIHYKRDLELAASVEAPAGGIHPQYCLKVSSH